MKFQRSSRAKQTGAFMLEISLALLISALAAVGTIRENARVNQMRSADSEADAIEIYRQALQHYVDDANMELQQGISVTRSGVTLAAGSAAGQAFKPTSANLIAMGYLPVGFTDTPMLVDGARFQNLITRTGVGCPATPINCNVKGLAWVDQPYVIPGTTEMNGPVVGQMMSRLGGFGGASLEGSSANVIGTGATWTETNPVPGAPAGVVAVRFGYNSAAFLNYVRINDLRDPNLQGGLTIQAGNFNVAAGTTTLAGAATINNNLTVTGTSNFGGTLAVTGGATFNNTLTVATGDANLRNTTIDGNLSVTGASGNVMAVGTISGTSIIPTGFKNPGQVCLASEEGAMAKSSSGSGILACLSGAYRQMVMFNAAGNACSNGQMAISAGLLSTQQLLCVNGTFQGMDTLVRGGVKGAACTDPSVTAIDTTNNNATLVCKKSPVTGALAYASLQDVTTNLSFADAFEVGDGNNVNSPICNAGGTPLIQLIPKTFTSPNGGQTFFATGTGPWVVYLKDGDGLPLMGSSKAIAQTFCYYP